MYLDTRGFVTVGKGKMLPTASDAVALAFLRQGTDVPASEDEIRAEYNLIAEMVEDVGRDADYFGQFTNLYLPQADVDRLVTDHMRGDFEALLQQYPGFGNLPLSVQIALWDMIYNLGSSGLAEFRLLRQAILDAMGRGGPQITQARAQRGEKPVCLRSFHGCGGRALTG